MTRHDLSELTAETFLEQAPVRRLCKHCRWARPAWHYYPVALPLPFLWREVSFLATCRHPTSPARPLRDYVSRKLMKLRHLGCNVRAPVITETGGPQAGYLESRS
jgi:hypothetical protein